MADFEMEVQGLEEELNAIKAINQKIQLEKNALKEQLIIQRVSNQRELLIDLLSKLEKGGGNRFVSKEWIVDNYLQDN